MSHQATAPTHDVPWDTPPMGLLDEARHLLVTQADALRALARRLDEAPTATTLDVFIALETLKKDAKAISEKAGRAIGDRDNGVMSELLDEFAERGVNSERHAQSGRLAHINNRIFAGVRRGVPRAEAAKAMQRVPELEPMVELGFNLNTLSSHFREQVRARFEATGTPISDEALAELIPAELRGLLTLTHSPVISVRS